MLPTGAAYAQVYVANESNVPVWFDDVKIEHWQGLQVQENHYDPFGLDLAGLSRSTPGLRTLNQYQWNGKEKQNDFGLGWTHLDWRFFDAQTGRFHTVDPLSDNGQEMWSTYQFGFDNAMRYNDPDGRAPGDGPPVVGSAVGLLYNTVVSAGVSLANASIMSVPALDALTTLTVGGTIRASVGADGDVSYGIRPTATTMGGFLANTASDALDMGSAALTVMTFGEGAAVSGGVRMGAGLLLSQGGQVVQQQAVQAGKQALRSANRVTHSNSLASKKLTTLYRLETKEGEYLKTGITSNKNPETRYTKEFMKDKNMITLDQGQRAKMAKKERHIVERNPGPLNNEKWAGSKKIN